MGTKDHSEKLLEDHNDVFADIYNTLLFKEDFLDPAKLVSGPTASIYKAADGDTAEQIRDVRKFDTDGIGLNLASLGIENQSQFDAIMPIRIMNYDASDYMTQVRNNENNGRIYPVLTIILNFSDTRWQDKKDLHSIITMPEKMKSFVRNYEIYVFDIAYLEDDVIDSFKSDFGIVARFFKNKRLHKDPLDGEDKTMTYPLEILNLFSVFMGDKRYSEIGEKIVKTKNFGRENVNMCWVIDEIEAKGRAEGEAQGIAKGEAKGRAEGRTEGRAEGLKSLMSKMKWTFEQAADAMSIPTDEWDNYRKMVV